MISLWTIVDDILTLHERGEKPGVLWEYLWKCKDEEISTEQVGNFPSVQSRIRFEEFLVGSIECRKQLFYKKSVGYFLALALQPLKWILNWFKREGISQYFSKVAHGPNRTTQKKLDGCKPPPAKMHLLHLICFWSILTRCNVYFS